MHHNKVGCISGCKQFNIKTSIKSNHYLYRLKKKNIITSIDTEKILMFLHSVIKSPSKVGI